MSSSIMGFVHKGPSCGSGQSEFLPKSSGHRFESFLTTPFFRLTRADRYLTFKLLELIDITEGMLAHLASEQGPILRATIPSYINGEQVEVLVEARQLDDGSPSNDVRVTVKNADGVELGSQHTQVQLLGNAEEIRRALLAGAEKKDLQKLTIQVLTFSHISMIT